MKKLTDQLLRAGWISREERYKAVFKDVSVNHEVADPLASVIIISWRFVEGLQENLRRLKHQRSIKYEIIFVNNGNDEKEFLPIKDLVDVFITLDSNTGAYLARNIGSLFASAPILIFLEDDGIIGESFVASHLGAYAKYDIISVRGVCLPLTKNPLNKLARHYNMGRRAFPAIANLEGNSSFRARAFYEAGGWNDDINFGHGGPELSYRLTQKYPDQRMQIYHPAPVIHHDYAKNIDHLNSKRAKQQASYEKLREQYPDLDQFFKSWNHYRHKRYVLRRNRRAGLIERTGDVVDYLLYEILKPAFKQIWR